ncbi:hypothetical protein C1646_751688 [Rhizophagus diaphanus]|nr:hypothetical protein C1646_751688 [Rhizophagus diaphanus] [Rhizophagus sp. MUCL 43196]
MSYCASLLDGLADDPNFRISDRISMIKLVKQIYGLPKSYPTSALYHQYILGINNP